MEDNKLCGLCLVQHANKLNKRFDIEVCENCEKQIQKYFQNLNQKVQQNDWTTHFMKIRQIIQDKYLLQKKIILADTPYFSDQYIDKLHDKIHKISSNIKHIQEQQDKK